MNWGYKIALASALFMGYIIFLVVKCMQQDIDLVDKFYYKEEIEYQKQISKLENAEKDSKLFLKYEPSQQALLIQLTADKETTLKGRIQLFRPSDDRLDKVFLLQTDKSGKQSISTSQLMKGLWRVKVSWTNGKQDFYKEERMVL